MKVKLLKSFSLQLADQVGYIAKDKPKAARQFKKDILMTLEILEKMPFLFIKSFHFQDENIRELTFKGYKIIYRVNVAKDTIQVFALLKYRKMNS
jgi:plasmid stabilization system protein ParE